MTDDELFDRLGALEYELIDAQTVRHERAIYNKMFALFEEYNQPDMVADLKGSIRYRAFELTERGEMSVDALRQMKQDLYNSSAKLAEAIYITM